MRIGWVPQDGRQAWNIQHALLASQVSEFRATEGCHSNNVEPVGGDQLSGTRAQGTPISVENEAHNNSKEARSKSISRSQEPNLRIHRRQQKRTTCIRWRSKTNATFLLSRGNCTKSELDRRYTQTGRRRREVLWMDWTFLDQKVDFADIEFVSEQLH